LRALAPGVLLLSLACASEPPGEDLLAALPHAVVRRADGELLLSERVARSGWGLVERDGEGEFRWAVGGESWIGFHSLAAGETTLVARARGAIAPGDSVQPVRLALNGREIARLDLGPDWTDLELSLAPPLLRRGANRLTFEFGRPLEPPADAGDARPLAACFRTLRLGAPIPLPEEQRPLRLDLADAAVAGLLGEGWSEPAAANPEETSPEATGPEGAGWRWAPAPTATLRLDLPPPADRRLVLTARRPDRLTSQRLELWLNGHQLGSHDLATEWSTATFDAPREEWLAGANELVLRFSTLLVEQGASHSAQVARLTVETLAEPALAADGDRDGPRVRQPAATSVDLFRRLPERSPRLLLAAAAPGGAPARVALDLEPDGGAPAEVWRGELTADRPHEVDLSPWAGELARLRLSAPGPLVWRRLELAGTRTAVDAAAAPGVPELPAAAARPSADPSARPNLLLYVIDTLRADHTSLYGYPRRTTPRLEALAAEGILFDPAWANASWTRPGTATLLTGALPSVHGAMNTLSVLAPDVELLSQTLGAAGYATHALVTNPNLGGRWGLDRGWDEYRYIDLDLRFTDSSAVINREVIPRLAELAAAERPFFLYLHSMDPHAPYHPPAGYRQFLDPVYAGPVDGSMASVGGLLERLRRDGAAAHAADLEQLRGLYDGGILHNDTRIGELVDAMADLGLLESTAILVTSDHGEELFEHGGFMHGHSLYQELIRIPMLLRPPGGVAPRRIAGAQQVDVAVMLAALAGVAVPPTAIGRDLPAVGDAAARPVFAEEELRDRRLWSFVEDGMKLHYNRSAHHADYQRQETHELFDLVADPDETINLYAARPVVAGYLLERARTLAAGLSAGADREMIDPEELGEELRGQLRALGYLQ
jgi:arylsulfatase A-like enzyme